VQRWADAGEGVVAATEGGEFRLFVGERLVVFFFVDSAADAMHVWRVRRA
jgi:hypothetical protein